MTEILLAAERGAYVDDASPDTNFASDVLQTTDGALIFFPGAPRSGLVVNATLLFHAVTE